eukprot:TRINITY_DN10755_c0_g1_i1.p1 TRINITY_DN10755_c0_g1~~TRINITY_DN10755_c0_g1_i1.p1  ORF type:complete len:288 (-),score=60.81 TRINITY_DN10755_c0_g1_i1:67-930(-)
MACCCDTGCLKTLTMESVEEAATHIRTKTSRKPRIGMILGSGLGALANDVSNADRISYGDIPHFPVSTVEGHAGELVIGTLGGQECAVMSGRVHAYEGWSLRHCSFPVRVMRAIGCDVLVVTNAAGGVNEAFQVGDLMIITDHINLLGSNPLFGANFPQQGPRFPDMSSTYSKEFGEIVRKVAEREKITTLKEGVYAAFTGPSYETPAEIRMARTLGADAVGMSTVPEAIVASHCGMRILGISCVTNMASGIQKSPLNHAEVVETTVRVNSTFRKLVLSFLEEVKLE